MTTHQFRQMSDGTIIDTTSGEELGGKGNRGTFIFVPSRPKLKESWFMFFQSACEQLALDKDLSGESFRVLMHLLSTLDFENYILIQQSEIADKLGMQRSHVSRAVKQLLDRGILVKGGKIGRTYSYKLNSAYGWKGRVVRLFEEGQGRIESGPRLVVDNSSPSTHPQA